MLRFDHVVIAVADLDAASQRMQEDHGLESVAGGRHTGHGTANRLVPLGHDYLELVAVVDPVVASGSPFGGWVGAHASPGSSAGLCLRTTAIDSLAGRLDLAPVPMSRIRPDGVELRWRLLGLDVALEQGLPFFIEWDVRPDDHPGRAAVRHRVAASGISWVELGGDQDRINRWVGRHDLDLRPVDGPPGVHRLGVASDSGELVL